MWEGSSAFLGGRGSGARDLASGIANPVLECMLPCNVVLSSEPGKTFACSQVPGVTVSASSITIKVSTRASGWRPARTSSRGLLLTQIKKARLGDPRKADSTWGWQARECISLVDNILFPLPLPLPFYSPHPHIPHPPRSPPQSCSEDDSLLDLFASPTSPASTHLYH